MEKSLNRQLSNFRRLIANKMPILYEVCYINFFGKTIVLYVKKLQIYVLIFT